MAHFAKITDSNEVLTVLTLNDSDTQNSEGVETESVGQQYLQTHNNWPAEKWIQCSYNTFENKHKLGGTPFRGNYPETGYEWDATNNIFWPPKPFPSWVKDTTNARWTSPIGDAPALTETQINQNTDLVAGDGTITPATNHWVYVWSESDQSWNLTDALA